MKSDDFSRNHPLRIGLFGGTFNPIHRGHVQAAVDVLHAFDLQRIYFIPSASPPHKAMGDLADAQHRAAMVRLAVQDHPRLMVCDVEIERSGPSYSIDTIRHFKSAASKDTNFFFILGVDAFLEIHTWHHFTALLEETDFIVMSRPGSGLWSDAVRREIEAYVRQHIGAEYRLSGSGDLPGRPGRPDIHLASVTPVNIASTRLRRMIRQGEAITDWVAPSVARYIQERGLYQ